jgi:hypothetical protein
MSVEHPKRRGRPPSDPTSGAAGRGAFHLGLRLNEHRRDQLVHLVELANGRAKAAGIPANVSPSSLVTLWIQERLDLETAKLGRKK